MYLCGCGCVVWVGLLCMWCGKCLFRYVCVCVTDLSNHCQRIDLERITREAQVSEGEVESSVR